MDRADLEMEIRRLRGENQGIKKTLNHCPPLAFPEVVIDCGVYKKLEGNNIIEKILKSIIEKF